MNFDATIIYWTGGALLILAVDYALFVAGVYGRDDDDKFL